MPSPITDPILARKFTPRYLAALIGIALGILVVGSALRPRKPASGAVPPPTQTEMRRLQRLAERRELETMSNHFAGIASDVGPGILQVATESGSGVAWTPNLVVGAGHRRPMAESTTLVDASGEALASLRVVAGPDLPLAAFQVSGRLTPLPRRRPDAPKLTPGQWLVAVWQGDSGLAFAPGHHVETRLARCGPLAAREIATSLDFSAPMAGAGLFDLDGALVGMVLRCEERYTALSLESVSSGLAQGRTVEGRLCARHGLGVIPLEETLRAHLGAESGVLVSEVWTGFSADLIGLHPGDVIVGVDGKPVASVGDLTGLLDPNERREAVLTVWRARRLREFRLPGGPAEEPPPGNAGGGAGLGLGLATPPPGFPIGPIVPGSLAAEAGIREGDHLLRVEFSTPRSAAEAGRALSRRGEPVFVEIQRGSRRFGALLG